MEVIIKENISGIGLIHPNVIYNRCDLWSSHYVLIEVFDGSISYNFMLSISGAEGYLGVWLMDIPKCVLEFIEKTIFERYSNLKSIKYEYGLVATGYFTPKNHFRITLPNSEEELRARLSKKGRYNIKREKDILTKTFGNYTIEEYTSDNCPKEIIDVYFRMKRVTHKVDYRMSADEYMKIYHVSDIYVLKLGDAIGAILLSCEQCSVVYIENLTYDINYAKYSCGQILYDIYLTRLIKKGFRELFLAGGDLDYKKRYGSVEEPIFNCIVFRSKIEHFFYATHELIRKKVKTLLSR